LTNLVRSVSLRALEEAVVKRKKAKGVHEPVSLYDAKTHLSELVERAAQGEEITIAKSGKPKARLVPLAPKNTSHLRVPGRGKGTVWIAPDFDAPLPPEVQRLFEAPL
jgi:prevent-host-death family protein